MTVLDCGCGPSITRYRGPDSDGTVVGVDMNEAQVKLATEAAAGALINVSFRQEAPTRSSFRRFLRRAVLARAAGASERWERRCASFCACSPGGVAGVCAPDWGGSCSLYTE